MRILPSFFLLAFSSVAAFAGLRDARQALNQLPAWFEPNAEGTAFVSRSSSVTLRVDGRGAQLVNRNGLTQLEFAGSTGAAKIAGHGRQQVATNYFVGRNKADWRRDVARYDGVTAEGVYPGIDVVYYPNGKNLEYDFVVAPGSNPDAIRLRFAGTAKPRVTGEGELLLAGGLKQHAPIAYQEGVNGKELVTSRFRLMESGDVRFELGAYDHQRKLVIDPVISWAGYFGGDRTDLLVGATVSADGGYWITGSVNSYSLPEGDTTPYQATIKESTDVYLVKVMPTSWGSWRMAYFTYIGGTAEDLPTGIAMMGYRVILTGTTQSIDFPLAGYTYQTSNGGGVDSFLLMFDPTDNTYPLNYSTYYGGTDNEYAKCVAALPDGRVVIAGSTKAGTLPGVSDGATLQPSNRGGSDGWLAYFNLHAGTAAGTFVYGTFFGGNSSDLINSVALDSKGLVYATGMTLSDDLPLAGASYQAAQQSIGDAFLLVLDVTKPTFDAMIYTSYFGGSGLDAAQSLAIDAQGRVWITGYTESSDLPVTPGAYQLGPKGGFDGFIARLDPTKAGSDFVTYCTYYGGTGSDIPYALAVDPTTGNAVIAGYTLSGDIPVKNMDPFYAPPAGSAQVFVASINPNQQDADGLAWALTYGGHGLDIATALAIDADGNVFTGGYSNSGDLRVGNTPGKPSGGGFYSSFYFRVAQ